MTLAAPPALASSAVDASRSHLLEVRGLSTRFAVDDGLVHAVTDVSFHIDAGEVLAIVGESGSGKSVTMLSVMGLIPQPPGRITSGQVLFEGTDLLTLPADRMRRLRGSRLAMIFQEPVTSLNPVFTVGSQIDEAVRAHLDLDRRETRRRTVELLDMVRIADAAGIVERYPHQLSGGMCQRVVLAMALACRPALLIADEPTTALDITTQSQLLELIRGLQAELRMAVVWITHDLGIVAGLADRVMVMYAGRIVETADVDPLYADPLHPYTQGLLRAIPRIDHERADRLVPIPGAPPDLARPPEGCAFVPRCAFKLDRCAGERPPLAGAAGDQDHQRACWAPESALRAVSL